MSSGCPNQDYQPDFAKLIESSQQAQESAIKALDNSGALSCKYKNSQGQVQYCVGKAAGISVGCGQASINHQETQGCSSVAMMTNTVNNMKTMIKCVLNNSQASTSIDMNNTQKIKLKLGNVTGSTIDLSQDNSVTVKMANVASGNTQSAIADVAKNAIVNAVAQEQKSANEAFSNPQSKIAMQNLSANMNDYANSSNISNSVSQVVANIYSDQTIEISAGDINNSNIKISQKNAVDLVSEVFVNQIMSDMMSSQKIMDAQTQMAQSMKEENKSNLWKSVLQSSNMETLMSGFVLIILAILVMTGAFIVAKKKKLI